jgi:1-deoxy-D-xylulose-5-phosphate reductoisomerase
MTVSPRSVVVLGSTGSIGRSALEVILAAPDELRVVGLSAHTRLDLLVQQARRTAPRWVVATDPAAAAAADWSGLPGSTQLLVGAEAIPRLAAEPDVDVVVCGIVGSAGLQGTWAALDAGKTVALANKEPLVMAGPLVMELARTRGARLIPVDSEHSAIFQCLQAGRSHEVRRVVLTASGGPFRNHSPAQLAHVTVAEALAHPTWNMGDKITIDSATLMNKALEIVEARWLFDLSPDQIDVVIHPQSIVHSLVEFVDGSVVAQLSPPDMKLPIQYALHYPHRRPGPAAKLDWSQRMALEFEPPDPERFPALELGHQLSRAGGTSGAVVNAANEVAVGRFLAGELRFDQIVPLCRNLLESHHFEPHPSLEQLLRVDRWARQEAERWN